MRVSGKKYYKNSKEFLTFENRFRNGLMRGVQKHSQTSKILHVKGSPKALTAGIFCSVCQFLRGNISISIILEYKHSQTTKAST